MRLVKAIVGAIIGGLIGVAVVVAVQVMMQVEARWLDLLIGFCVGVGVRLLTAGKRGPSYLSGALAALVTLIAIIAAKHTAAAVLTSRATGAEAPPPPAAAVDAQPSAEVEGGAVQPAAEAGPVIPVVDEGALRPGGGRASGDATEFIWLGLAAAIAYFFGRGSDAARESQVVDSAAAADDAHSQQAETAADDPQADGSSPA